MITLSEYMPKASRGSPPGKIVTIREVAREAGVSIATVSRVFADSDAVKPLLKQQVLSIAERLNYRPSGVARNLRARSTRTIGVLIPDILNHFFTATVKAIEDVLQAAGYSMLLGHSNDDPERESRYLSTLRTEGVAGVIFSPTNRHLDGYAHLQSAGIPLVAIARDLEGLQVDTVLVSNEKAGLAGTRHLVALGHKRIGVINGPQHLSNARARLKGYHRGLREAGLPVREELIALADFRQPRAYEAMGRMLDLPEPPTAIFVTNEVMALGALQALQERGCRIPHDIAFVGFDDPPWTRLVDPPLTVLRHPPQEIGLKAAEILMARLREPDRPCERLLMDTELIIRRSCGAVRLPEKKRRASR